MARKRGKIVPHTCSADGETFYIWGDTTKLQEFFEGITESTQAANPGGVILVPQCVVKRYPGDAGFIRKDHLRKVPMRQGLKRGTTPGRPFVIEEDILNSSTLLFDVRTTQFTWTGTVTALRTYAAATAKSDFRLRWSTGRFMEVGTAGDDGGATALGALGTDTLAVGSLG